MSDTKLLHGIPIPIPAGWEDFSSFVYLAPPAVPSRKKKLRTLAEVRELQPAIVVTRHRRPPEVALAQVFAESNQLYLQQNASFKAGAAREVRFAGRLAVAQDSTQLHAASKLQVTQRHIAVDAGDLDYVLLAITGSARDVETMSQAIGCSLE